MSPKKNITAVSLQATVCSLLKGENDVSHDFDLSSNDEDAPIGPPKSFLKYNMATESASSKNENSLSFSPNSDDELAKYLDSEIMSYANIKKEKAKDPDYSPSKIIKKEKKRNQQSQKKMRWT